MTAIDLLSIGSFPEATNAELAARLTGVSVRLLPIAARGTHAASPAAPRVPAPIGVAR